jgi:hypothetical protein
LDGASVGDAVGNGEGGGVGRALGDLLGARVNEPSKIDVTATFRPKAASVLLNAARNSASLGERYAIGWMLQ